MKWQLKALFSTSVFLLVTATSNVDTVRFVALVSVSVASAFAWDAGVERGREQERGSK